MGIERGVADIMTKMLLICARNRQVDSALERRAAAAMRELAPDDLAASIEVETASDLVIATLNGGAAKHTPRGVLLGRADDGWDAPGARPDGTFAIVRWSQDEVEVVSDVLATRTTWWVLTDEYFLASSSQVALVSFLGDLQFNAATLPWMLASGSLGPDSGWDERFCRVPADATIRLDRASWTVATQAGPIAFAADLDDADARPALAEAVAASFASFDPGETTWRLPLSGGADSRGILQHLLRAGIQPPCITWGRRQALKQRGTDASIAWRLARAAGLPHEYHVVEPDALAPDVLLDRFLANGEGRIDHLGGYLDGFAAWRTLHDHGVQMILRGDEAFGWSAVDNERQARTVNGLILLSDLLPADVRAALDLPDHAVPAELARRPEESVAAWRDRLYHQFRVPVVLAALTDLKLAYTELINPLLSRRIIETVRRMPDAARTEKRAWIDLVEQGEPGGPFAKSGALLELGTVLRSPAFRDYMREQIASDAFTNSFSPAFATWLLHRLEANGTGGRGRLRLLRLAKAMVPAWAIGIAKRQRTRQGPRADGFALALRAVIAVRMRDRLQQAAERGRAVGGEQTPERAWTPAPRPAVSQRGQVAMSGK